MQKNIQEYLISHEKELDDIIFPLVPGDRIFFIGDLGVGKSTFIRLLLKKYMNDDHLIVRSPTYTYYQKYTFAYHCDLYRVEDYSTWLSIGGEELLSNLDNIFLIEWPDILGDRVKPTKKISIEIIEDGSRKVRIENII